MNDKQSFSNLSNLSNMFILSMRYLSIKNFIEYNSGILNVFILMKRSSIKYTHYVYLCT